MTRVSPVTLKAKSTIKIKFSEKVKGVSKKSIKLFWLKGVAQKHVFVKTKVRSLKKGKAASVDPKHRLKPGTYLLLFKPGKIRDKRGNPLAPSVITPVVSSMSAGLAVPSAMLRRSATAWIRTWCAQW